MDDFAPAEIKNNICYLHNNDIYITNEFHEKITNSPTLIKSHLSLHPDLDKIAYLDHNLNPVVIDLNGNVLEHLTQYNNIKNIRWHANNGNPTLYMLQGNTIIFHGPTLDIPSNTFDFAFPTNSFGKEIDAVFITKDLDVVFGFRYQEEWQTSLYIYHNYYYGAATNYKTSSKTDKVAVELDDYYNPVTQNYEDEYYIKIVSLQVFDSLAQATYAWTVNKSIYPKLYLDSYFYQTTTSLGGNLSYYNSSSKFGYNTDKGLIQIAEDNISIRWFADIPSHYPRSDKTNRYGYAFSVDNNMDYPYIDWVY